MVYKGQSAESIREKLANNLGKIQLPEMVVVRVQTRLSICVHMKRIGQRV